MTSRRTGIIAGLCACVLVASGIWYARRDRVAPAPAASTTRLLVVPFENLTGDARYNAIGTIAADRLALRMAQLGSIDVVPPMTVLLALRDSGAGRARQLSRLASATRAGQLVSGSVVLRGDSVELQAQVVDVSSGKTIITLEPVGGHRSDPIAAIDAIADRLLGALARLRGLKVLPGGARAPTYAAYEAYAAGFDRFARAGDNIGSRPYFARAIELDSSYAQAYFLLARQYMNRGEFDRADSLLQRIDHLPGSLTSAERIQLANYRAELDGNYAGRLQRSEELLARDSAGVSLWLVGEAATDMMHARLAIQVLTAAESTFALIGGVAAKAQVETLAEAYHESGVFAQELQVLSAHPADPGGVPARQARLLRSFAGLRQPARAIALADTLLRAGNDTAGSRAYGVLVAAMEFRAHDDDVTARRLAAMSRAWYAAHREGGTAPDRMFAEGVSLLMNNDAAGAAIAFESLARATARIDAAGYEGVAAAARGDRARARVIADSLGGLKRRWLFGEHTFWRAAIVGALGDRELAVQLLQQAHAEGQPMQSWHYARALEALHGFAPFDALLRPLP